MTPSSARRVRTYAFSAVTTAIVLVFAVAEWAVERYISDRSRAASVTIEIAIVIFAALLFRPVHRRTEAWVEAAFYRRRHQALAALTKFRHELHSFNDMTQLLRRVVEAVDHYLEARACAVYLRREGGFRAEASTFDACADAIDDADPLAVRLRSSGLPARPPLLKSTACGTHAFPINAAGDLVGFIAIDCKHGEYEPEETQMLSGLAQDLGAALIAIDPKLRAQKQRPRNNIPADLPQPIGRAHELAELNAALAQTKLLTLTGPGGVGKTRIAVQCAAEAIDLHEDGAWFVSLAPITDPELVVPTLLSALHAGSPEQGRESERLIEHLRSRDALIVIDNCEQVLAAAASIVAQIRANCPRVTVVATSRELLHLDGEQVYRLGSLRTEAAAELFAQRAIAVAPEFDAHRYADAVRAICEHLDGIPLAIELAAARVRALSPDEILQFLSERFRLLTGGARTADPRQQTLAATIAWSYDLLSAEEQSLFLRLSAFRGSFTLAGAAAVCARDGTCDEFHALDVLTSLADKSLLVVNVGLATRYRLLETIREFAAQRNLESQAAEIVARQHAAYFAALAAQAYHEFDSRMPPGWLDRLAPDIDNFRAALEFTLSGAGDRRTGAQLAADCGPVFLRMELLGEGLRWCGLARNVTDIVPATSGRIEYVASMMHHNLGQYDRALACAERAVAVYAQSADKRGHIRALSQTAQLYSSTGRSEDAAAPALESIRLARVLGEPRVLAGVLRRSASALSPQNIDMARTLFTEARDIAQSVDDPEERCLVFTWWGSREAAAGNYDRARSLAQDALACSSGKQRMYLEGQIACYALAAGDVRAGEPHAREALTLAIEAEHPLLTALAIAFNSRYYAEVDAVQAAQFFGCAQKRLRELKWQSEGELTAALDAVAAAIAAMVGDERFSPLAAQGEELSAETVAGTLSAFSREPESSSVAVHS